MSADETAELINRLYAENDALRKKNTQYEKEKMEEKKWISKSAGVFLITHGGTPFVVVTQKENNVKICKMEDCDKILEQKVTLG